jgi:eukaryotic-like serine/threonine-protein kinase
VAFSLFPRRDPAAGRGAPEFVSTIAVPPPSAAGRRETSAKDEPGKKDAGAVTGKGTGTSTHIQTNKAVPGDTKLAPAVAIPPTPLEKNAAQPTRLFDATTAGAMPAPAAEAAGTNTDSLTPRTATDENERSGPDSLASDWIHDSALMPDSRPAPLHIVPALPQPARLPQAAQNAADRADHALRDDLATAPAPAPIATPDTAASLFVPPLAPTAQTSSPVPAPPLAATSAAPLSAPGPSQLAEPIAVPPPTLTVAPDPATAPVPATSTTAAAPSLAPAAVAVIAPLSLVPAPSVAAAAVDPAALDAAALDPVAALPTLVQIGRYALKRVLPTEGLGTLHEAWDPLLSRSVAIKTMQFDSNAKARASLDSLFLKEARGLASLTHPYIMTVYDAGLAVQGVYFAMERLHGASLRERLLEGWKFGPASSCQLVRRMADALAYAHAHGVLHGDVKPATVFITQRGRPKLVDFGVARVMQRSALASHGAGPAGNSLADPVAIALLHGGSPHYMAPEQLQGGKVDARSDVYSLGVVLYELLAGRLAFNGDTPEQVAVAVLTNHPAPAHLLRPGLSADLAAIASQAMARNPAERYASAAEFAQELRRWFDTFKPTIKPAPGMAPPLAPTPAASLPSPAPPAADRLVLKRANAAPIGEVRVAKNPPPPARDEGPITVPMVLPAAPVAPSAPHTAGVTDDAQSGSTPFVSTLATHGVTGITAGSTPNNPTTVTPVDTTASGLGPTLGFDQAQPHTRAAAQVRFLAGLVVVLAALCGGLVAYMVLR